jgi:hypothetical protein
MVRHKVHERDLYDEELRKVFVKEFKELPDDRMEKYRNMAKADLQRYRNEMEEYSREKW